MKISAILTSKKARPFLIGGGVLLLGVVLFSLVKNAGGGSQAGTSSGPSEALQAAQLQANTQVTLAQIQANAQGTGVAAQLQAAMDANSRDINLATIAANSHLADNDAQLQLGLANLSAQQNIAAMANQTQQLGLQAQTAVQIAGINAQTLNTQAQFDFLTNQSAIQANRDVDLANIGANAQTQQAQIAGKVAKNNSTWSTIGSVAVAALAFFSDTRVKKSITWTGIRDDNVSTYRWEYDSAFDKSPRMGYLAQNVRSVYPQAVREDTWTGFLKLLPNMMSGSNVPHANSGHFQVM